MYNFCYQTKILKCIFLFSHHGTFLNYYFLKKLKWAALIWWKIERTLQNWNTLHNYWYITRPWNVFAMIHQTFSIYEVVVPYFENACFKKTFYVKKGENDGYLTIHFPPFQEKWEYRQQQASHLNLKFPLSNKPILRFHSTKKRGF